MTPQNQNNEQPLLLLPPPLKNGEKTVEEQKNNPQTGHFLPGNPGGPGRPMGMQNFTTRVRNGLAKLSAKDPQGNPVEVEEALAEKVIKMALAGNVRMIELIWNYLDGKPPQTGGGNTYNQVNFYVQNDEEDKRVEDLFEPKDWPKVEIIKPEQIIYEQPASNKTNGKNNRRGSSLPEINQQGSAYEGSA
jgi:hypothetical protein